VQTPFYESTGGGAPLTTGDFLKPFHGESQETQRSKPMILVASLSCVRTSFVVDPKQVVRNGSFASHEKHKETRKKSQHHDRKFGHW